MKKAILKTDMHLTPENVVRIKRTWKAFIESQENDCLVLDGGIQIEIIDAEIVDGNLIMIFPNGDKIEVKQ